MLYDIHFNYALHISLHGSDLAHW